jgi:two-component sensor histidine kinase
MQWLAQTLAYGLSRTKYYRWGVFVSLAALFGMALWTGLQAPQFTSDTMALHFMWVVLPMLFGSMILSQRQTAVMATTVFLGFVLFPLTVPGLDYIDIAPVMFFIGMWSVAHILLLRQNELAERNRRVEIQKSAKKLTEINQILLQENAERQQAEKQLAASLNEKEVLLKEIHHRVKNNLQVISSLLNLQVQQTTDEAVLQALHQGRSRIRSMALLHQILYRSDDLTRIDFAAYVRQLSTQLCQSYHTQSCPVAVEVVADEVSLNIETAVPCGLILNELVSNALKHGFVDGRSGQIVIHLKAQDNNRIHLTVSDNGVGLPTTFDYRQSPSLGLQLVNNLVEQLEGDLIVSNHQGTSITITFEDSVGKPQKEF